MRFFRDLSRSKARRRLHTESSLVTLMMGNEEILTVRDHDESGDGTAFTLTLEELAEKDGENGRPLYLSIRGRVYDVTKGRSFYGKGRSYHHFVARDATRAFATNCKQPACLISTLDGLSNQDKKEIDRWVELVRNLYMLARLFQILFILLNRPLTHYLYFLISSTFLLNKFFSMSFMINIPMLVDF